jgi:hypothetical protein
MYNYHLTLNNVTLLNACYIHKFTQEDKFDSVIKFGILNNKQNSLTSFRGEKKFGHVKFNETTLYCQWIGQILKMITFLTHN